MYFPLGDREWLQSLCVSVLGLERVDKTVQYLDKMMNLSLDILRTFQWAVKFEYYMFKSGNLWMLSKHKEANSLVYQVLALNQRIMAYEVTTLYLKYLIK